MGLPDLSRKLSAEIHARLKTLAGISDDPACLTRTFLSPAHGRARQQVGEWMAAAGLEVFEDSRGNVIGRKACADADAATVACGSHLDTVRNAGRYDGALGVLAGIQAAEELRRRSLPYHLEIVAFSDEEGVRFQSAYLGSRFYAGDGEPLRIADTEGLTFEEALAAHQPSFPAPPARKLFAYVEAHIEQGPVLEAGGMALGVVSAIAGQTRAKVILEGSAGHAGTVPMPLRKDALTGAAECLLLVEQSAREAGGLVATAGEIHVDSAAGNVIPGLVTFSLDIRDADDEKRRGFVSAVFEKIRVIARVRGLIARIEIRMDSDAVPCDPLLSGELARLVETRQGRCPLLASGAGHDAVALAKVARVAMLFVRCRGGLSHHPDEYAAPDDIDAAVQVLSDFLSRLQPVVPELP